MTNTMRRIALRFAGALVLVVSLLSETSCGRSMSVSYRVSIDSDRPGVLRVAMAIRGAHAGDLTIRGFNVQQVLRVSEVRAAAASGASLVVAEALETLRVGSRFVDIPRFVIPHFSGGALRLEYLVTLGSREGDGHIGYTGRCHGYAGPEFVFATGRDVFLLPEPVEGVGGIEVRFDLPGDWTAMVPWRHESGAFIPGAQHCPAAEHLVAAPIALGRFHDRTFAVGGTTFRLAFEEKTGAADTERAASGMERAARYVHDLFGRGLGPEYLVVAAPKAPTGDEIVGEAWGTGQGGTFVPLTANRLQKFAEGLLDAYLRHAPYRTEIQRAEEFWLVDGLRHYYSWLAVAEAGLIPHEEITRGLAFGYLSSLSVHGINRDLERLYSLEGAHRVERETLAPFVLAYLDHRLRAESGGQRGLDTVLQTMFRGHRAKSLWDTLPASSEGSWKEFREQFVRGGADIIPIDPFYRIEPTTPHPNPPVGQAVRSLTVAYTGNTDGYLENCGCKSNQAGGVARRATVLSRLRRSNPSLLVLDAGNVFVRPVKQSSLDFLSNEELRLYMHLVDQMHYASIAVGTNELTFGLDHFRDRSRGLSVPFLVANVRSGGRPIAAPAAELSLGGLRIAVVGVFEPPRGRAATSLFEENTMGLEIDDPMATLNRDIPVLQSRADLVIALGRLTPPTIRRIAREVPGLDMVVSSEYDAPSVGDGANGDVHLQDKSGFVGRLLVAYSHMTTYGLTSVRIGIDAVGRIASAQFSEHWLYEDIPDHPKVRDLLNRFYDRVGREAAARDSVPPLFADDPVRRTGRYVGKAACVGCHEAEHAQWQRTKHASAYKTLLDRHRHFQPKCVSCHVVGYGTPTGYRLGMPEQTLANVQCEVCHGPGGEHVDAPSHETIRRDVPEAVCIECHNAEHSDHFVYADRLPKVKHDYVER